MSQHHKPKHHHAKGGRVMGHHAPKHFDGAETPFSHGGATPHHGSHPEHYMPHHEHVRKHYHGQ